MRPSADVAVSTPTDAPPGAAALVTGATSGIGCQFARYLAAKGHDLVIAGRREDRLRELAAELRGLHGTDVLIAAGDLSVPSEPSALFERVRAEGRMIDVLVNNAGLALEGRYLDRGWDQHEAYLRVMLLAPAELVHLFLPQMVERGHGRVINVASVSAWWPSTPFHTAYAPTKSWVVKFTRGLAEEYRDSGVTFTAVCPGVTRTDIGAGGMTEAAIGHLPSLLIGDPESVVREGYEGARAGRRVCIPGGLNRFMVAAMRHLPEEWPSRAVGHWMRTEHDRFHRKGSRAPS